MKFSVAQRSVLGGRKYNQDRIGRWSTGEALLMVVADGMGGHANGEVAAQVAVDILGRAPGSRIPSASCRA
jgi:serine/threonine protein phosphatase PrpC